MDIQTLLERQRKLGELLARSGLDALALNPGPSLTYMTGLHFHLSERPVVALFRPGSAPVLVLPELETPKLHGLPYEVQYFPYEEAPDHWVFAYQKALAAAGLQNARIGAEPRRMRLLEMNLLEEAAPGALFTNGQEMIAALRVRKSPAEIESMRAAAVIAEKALIAALGQFKPGMSERDFAAELTLQLLRSGSSPDLPFFPIVASGPNSANPHAFPTQRKIQPGDLLVIDWGATVDEYYSDITRTFTVGEVDPELKKIGELVLAANAAGRNAARAGVPAGSVDQAARKVIVDGGYGVYFTHRTGHGLGMEGHEEPYIRGDNQAILETGMVFTVEPGIYLPNRGGVRIEDDVVVTPEGIDCLTSLPREVIPVA